MGKAGYSENFSSSVQSAQLYCASWNDHLSDN